MIIWHDKPAFPAEHLNAGCQRVAVGAYLVDLNPGEPVPTQQEVDAALNPPPRPSEAEQLVQKIKDDPVALAALKAATK